MSSSLDSDRDITKSGCVVKCPMLSLWLKITGLLILILNYSHAENILSVISMTTNNSSYKTCKHNTLSNFEVRHDVIAYLRRVTVKCASSVWNWGETFVLWLLTVKYGKTFVLWLLAVKYTIYHVWSHI